MTGRCVVLFFCKWDYAIAVLKIKIAGSKPFVISPCENLDFNSARTIIGAHL